LAIKELELTVRNFLLVSLAAAVFVSFFVADAQAGTPPSVICKDRDKSNPQIEVDAAWIAQHLRDGFVKIHEGIEEYIAAMKKDDNFSDTHTQPFTSHLQAVFSAVLCADPADVSVTQDPKGILTFTIDYWRAHTNIIYETAKDHAVTPALIAGANHALNNNIKPDDRDQAIAQFNARALHDNQPMRIFSNPQGELELIATTVPNNASK
jgi:hypothetical protein